MLDFLESLAREAGAHLLELQHTNLKRFAKGSFDFATEADLSSQELIVSRLAAEYPNVAVLAEEQDHHQVPEGKYFAVDPLDGTIGYSAGGNSWGVIISFFEQGRPHTGVIFTPADNRMLTAKSGEGAQLNGDPVQLRAPQSLAASIAGTDIGAWLSEHARENFVLPLLEKAISVRSLGSSAAGSMELASGVTSIYLSACGAKIWDLAVGYLVVTESGGFACDVYGDELRWDQIPMNCIYAADDSIAKELLKIYRASV